MTRGLLEGSTTLVVGGATGIGRGVVERFVAEGSRVVVVDVDTAPLGGIARDLPRDVVVLAGDATEPAVAGMAVSRAVEDFGGVDTLVCCAGRFDFHTPIGSLSIEELSAGFDEIYAVNVKSMLLAVHAALPELRRRRGSVVLTVSSSAYHPDGAGVLYGSSKYAVRGLVAHLARELAPEVRVNGVAPGGTAGTRLAGLSALGERRTVDDVPGRGERLAAGNLLGRAALPADHAGAYLYLAAPDLSAFVTGAVVNSDGGRGEPIGGSMDHATSAGVPAAGVPTGGVPATRGARGRWSTR